MKRRCAFLDTFPAFNFNTGVGEPLKDGSGRHTDTKQLGSTLMVTMLEEVTNFCHPAIQQDWSKKPHQQVQDYIVNYIHHVVGMVSNFIFCSHSLWNKYFPQEKTHSSILHVQNGSSELTFVSLTKYTCCIVLRL